MLIQVNSKNIVLEIVELLSKNKIPYGSVREILNQVVETIDTLSIPDLEEDRKQKREAYNEQQRNGTSRTNGSQTQIPWA